MWNWITRARNAEGVTAIAAAIQAIGILLALAGVIVAIIQIRETRDALRATTALQLQKDGRDLIGSTDPTVADYIYAYRPGKKYDPDTVAKAQLRMIQILNYYAAASRQHDIGTVDESLWHSFDRELCRILYPHSPFELLWEQAVNEKIYSDNFLEAGQRCMQAGAHK